MDLKPASSEKIKAARRVREETEAKKAAAKYPSMFGCLGINSRNQLTEILKEIQKG